MASPVPAVGSVPKARVGLLIGRAVFVALVAGLVALPHLSGNGFEFPAVENGASLVPFALLMVLPLVDFPRPWRWAHADVIALLLPVASLVCNRPQRAWAILPVYAAFAYLVVRMARIARDTSPASPVSSGSESWLPLSWLIAGLVVLIGIHFDWALASHTVTDAGEGTVRGALRLVEGAPLYGASNLAHGDTYGPLIYEAYIPFALIFSSHAAAHIAALSYDLLTAALLFMLGYRRRGARAGVVLAYCWLAFPLTLFTEVFGFTDALIAATLAATLLVTERPRGRGYGVALAGWAKFSPFALLPLMASYRAAPYERSRRSLAIFAGAVTVASVLIVGPALVHSTPSELVSRTLGYQLGREPADSLWSVLQNVYANGHPWVGTASRLLHALVLAGAACLALLAIRLVLRRDVIGLAAISAAVLTGVIASNSYFSYNYVLWLAALVLPIIVLDRRPAAGLQRRLADSAAARRVMLATYP